MDYFACMHFIHNVKWLDIVHDLSLLCLAFIYHIISSLLLVPYFTYYMSAGVFQYRASMCPPSLPKDPRTRPVVCYCLAELHPPAYRYQHIYVLLTDRGRPLRRKLSGIPWQWAREGELTLTEGVGAGCQLSYLLHQAVAVGSEHRVLLNTLSSHAEGLLFVNSPVRPSSTAPRCVREAHPLWRSPHIVTSW